MWCGSCQQDVPGITTGVVPRPKCARCGRELARSGASEPHLSFGRVLESGVDLTAVAAARASRDLVSIQVDAEIRERLREVDYILKQQLPRWPRLQRRPLDRMRADPAAGRLPAELGSDLTVGEHARDAAVPDTSEQASTFFWAALAAMLAFLLTVGLIWPEVFETIGARFR